MSAKEILQNIRNRGYADSSSESRVVKLTEDEMKSVYNADAGNEVICEVHGTLDKDGKLHITSIESMDDNQDNSDEDDMAGEVAQRVIPSVVPSPS